MPGIRGTSDVPVAITFGAFSDTITPDVQGNYDYSYPEALTDLLTFGDFITLTPQGGSAQQVVYQPGGAGNVSPQLGTLTTIVTSLSGQQAKVWPLTSPAKVETPTLAEAQAAATAASALPGSVVGYTSPAGIVWRGDVTQTGVLAFEPTRTPFYATKPDEADTGPGYVFEVSLGSQRDRYLVAENGNHALVESVATGATEAYVDGAVDAIGLPATIEPAGILRGARDGGSIEYGGQHFPLIDTEYYGVTYNGALFDDNAWADLVGDLPVGGAAQGVLIRGISRIENPLIIPQEGTAGRNLNLIGANRRTTGFKTVGPNGCLAIGNLDRTGQLTGATTDGGVHSNFVVTGTNDCLTPLWVGYVSHVTLSDIFQYGGIEGVTFAQTQDATVNGLISSGSPTTESNLVCNFGANGGRFFGGYLLNAKRWIHVKSDDVPEAGGSVFAAGPGQSRFFGTILDHIRDNVATEGILIESGVGTMFVGCRSSFVPGGEVPWIRTIAPTGSAAPQNTTRISGGSIRTTAGDTPYLIEQEAGSGAPVAFDNVSLINLDTSPIYRAADAPVIARGMTYAGCAPIGAADDVWEEAYAPVAAFTALEAQGWGGFVSRTRIVRPSSAALRLWQEPCELTRYVDGELEVASVPNAYQFTMTPIQSDGTMGTPTTDIPTTQYESGGSIVAVDAGRSVGWRIYLDPATLTYYAAYPQSHFGVNVVGTKTYLDSEETYIVAPLLRDFVFLGEAVAINDTDNFGTAVNARFFPARAA